MSKIDLRNATALFASIALTACAGAVKSDSGNELGRMWPISKKTTGCPDLAGVFDARGERETVIDGSSKLDQASAMGVAWGHPRSDPTEEKKYSGSDASLLDLPHREYLTIQNRAQGGFEIVLAVGSAGYKVLVLDPARGDYTCSDGFLKMGIQKYERFNEGFGSTKFEQATEIARGADGALLVKQTLRHKVALLVLSGSGETTALIRFGRSDRSIDGNREH